MRITPLFFIVTMVGAVLSMALGYLMGGYAATGIDPGFGAHQARIPASVSVAAPVWQDDAPAMPDAGERGFDDRLLASTD